MLWILKGENPNMKGKFGNIVGKDLNSFKNLESHILKCCYFICYKRYLLCCALHLDPLWVSE